MKQAPPGSFKIIFQHFQIISEFSSKEVPNPYTADNKRITNFDQEKTVHLCYRLCLYLTIAYRDKCLSSDDVLIRPVSRSFKQGNQFSVFFGRADIINTDLITQI
jgi:hypothetical protein